MTTAPQHALNDHGSVYLAYPDLDCNSRTGVDLLPVNVSGQGCYREPFKLNRDVEVAYEPAACFLRPQRTYTSAFCGADQARKVLGAEETPPVCSGWGS
jgi:hypothetical protein